MHHNPLCYVLRCIQPFQHPSYKFFEFDLFILIEFMNRYLDYLVHLLKSMVMLFFRQKLITYFWSAISFKSLSGNPIRSRQEKPHHCWWGFGSSMKKLWGYFYICRLGTLRTLDDGEFDLLTFFKRLVTFALNGWEVDEDIVATFAGNESEALAAVEPFDRAGNSIWHCFLLLIANKKFFRYLLHSFGRSNQADPANCMPSRSFTYLREFTGIHQLESINGLQFFVKDIHMRVSDAILTENCFSWLGLMIFNLSFEKIWIFTKNPVIIAMTTLWMNSYNGKLHCNFSLNRYVSLTKSRPPRQLLRWRDRKTCTSRRSFCGKQLLLTGGW